MKSAHDGEKNLRPANLDGWQYLIQCVGNPTYAIGALTVAGQRRIFTELPPLEELLSCRRTKPQGVGVGN